MTVSQAFFDFDDFESFEGTGHVFYRMFLNCNLSDVLMIRLGLWVWGRKITEVKSYFHHITSKVHTINMANHYCVNLMTWLRKCLSGFPCKVTLVSLSHCTL